MSRISGLPWYCRIIFGVTGPLCDRQSGVMGILSQTESDFPNAPTPVGDGSPVLACRICLSSQSRRNPVTWKNGDWAIAADHVSKLLTPASRALRCTIQVCRPSGDLPVGASFFVGVECSACSAQLTSILVHTQLYHPLRSQGWPPYKDKALIQRRSQHVCKSSWTPETISHPHTWP